MVTGTFIYLWLLVVMREMSWYNIEVEESDSSSIAGSDDWTLICLPEEY